MRDCNVLEGEVAPPGGNETDFRVRFRRGRVICDVERVAHATYVPKAHEDDTARAGERELKLDAKIER